MAAASTKQWSFDVEYDGNDDRKRTLIVLVVLAVAVAAAAAAAVLLFTWARLGLVEQRWRTRRAVMLRRNMVPDL